MKHLVRDVSRVLTLFLASWQAWPKILEGKLRCFWGSSPQKRSQDKILVNTPLVFRVHSQPILVNIPMGQDSKSLWKDIGLLKL